MILAQLRNSLNLPLRSWAPLREIYIALALVGSASSLLAIAQSFGWQPTTQWGSVPAGFLFNSMAQGESLAILVVALATYRLSWFIPALLPGLYLSHSRGAFAALAFGIFASFFRRPLWLLAFALIGAALIGYNPGRSDIQRMQIWHAAATHLTFWGNGLGSFWNLWIGNPAWWPQYVHNDYLELVFELGVWSVPIFAGLGFAAHRTHTQAWPVFVTFLFLALFSPAMHIALVALVGGSAFTSTLGEPNA